MMIYERYRDEQIHRRYDDGMTVIDNGTSYRRQCSVIIGFVLMVNLHHC